MKNTASDKTWRRDWYEFERIDDGLTLVRERYVAAWLRCNMWLIHGREYDLLVDAGLGLTPLKPFVTEISGKDIVSVLTHCHFDHIGAADEFEQRLAHVNDAQVHRSPDQSNSGGVETFVRAETFLASPFDGFDFRDYKVRPAPLTGYLDEGDSIDLGNRVFQVFHLPGHSPGSIALYESSSRTLFSGDVIYDGELYDAVYHSNRVDYCESLRRLRNLPIETVHGGHYASFGGTRMTEIIDSYIAGTGAMGDADNWIESQLRPESGKS